MNELKRKPGRAKKAITLDAKLSTMLTAEEHARACALAESQGMTASSWLRTVINALTEMK